MGNAETCKNRSHNTLKLFLTNTRSVKGKITELNVLTIDYDIICLTETHIDQNIAIRSIIETPGFNFFRCDRNVNGGGVLVATRNQVRASEVKLDTLGEEMVIIRLPSGFAVCCYYRAHASLKNVDKVNNVCSAFAISKTTNSNHKVILLGDMTLPGINWTTSLIKKWSLT